MNRQRILIVDDELGPRESLRFLFKLTYDIVTAESVAKALHILANERFDLVISDIRMPDQSGIDLLREIRRLYPDTPVVMLTGFGALETAQESFRLGAVGYEKKPFDTNNIRVLIASVFARAQLREWVSMGFRSLQDAGADIAESPYTDWDLVHAAKTLVESLLQREILSQRPDTHGLYPFIVGGLLHDSINTLVTTQAKLTALHTHTEGQHTPEAFHKATGAILSGFEHLAKVLKLLQSISQDYYRPTTSRTDEAVLAHIDSLRHVYDGFTCLVDVRGDIQQTRFPPGVLSFLVGELVENAMKACQHTACKEIRLSMSLEEGGRTLSIECCDNGPGFPADILNHILSGQLNPPRAPGCGGYGLYFVKEIMGRIEGKILASNRDPCGARMQLLIPVRKDNK